MTIDAGRPRRDGTPAAGQIRPPAARPSRGAAAQALVETSSHGIIGLSADGRITSWSMSAELAYGYTAAEIIGRSLSVLVPLGEADRQIERVAEASAGHVVEDTVPRVRMDGSRFDVHVLITPVFAADAAWPAGGADPDDEEPDLRRVVGIAEARARLIAENATDMISTHAPNGVYIYVSPSCRRLLGYEPADLVGHSAYEFFHPEDLEAITESHSQVLELPVVWTVEYRIRRKDGSYIWFESTSRTIRDDDDVVLEIVAFSRDISDRKARELSSAAMVEEQRALAAQLEELNKMKGQFLAIAAHDLRSPMTAIAGFAELLLGHWERFDDTQRREYIQTIARSTSGAQLLVQDLLHIGRIESGSLTLTIAEVDALGCARQVASELNVSGSERVVVDGSEDLRARADEQRVLQILRNLAGNAVKFSDDGTPVRIAVFGDEGSVRIAVTDQGPGIEAEHVPLLFEPFVRVGASSARAPGTGLGLYICRKLADAMGGTITVDSEPEAGSTFTVTLPRA